MVHKPLSFLFKGSKSKPQPAQEMTTDPLNALLSIITSGVKDLQTSYAAHKLSVPSLDEPIKPSPLDDDEKVNEATRLIVAAATQLIATVRSPRDTIWEQGPSMYQSALLSFVVDVNIPEILNESPTGVLHAKDIAAKAGCDPLHIARVLRYLATRHVFKEVTPDVFANNRVSSELIKANKKTVAQLQEKPLEKYVDAGTAAFIGHVVGEGLPSSVALVEFLKTSGKAGKTPFNMAFKTDKTLWEWFMTPDQSWRFGRFVAAMQYAAAPFKDEIFVNAFDWGKLGSNDVVVDIGGNMGTVILALAKTFKEPKFVVQDLPPVIEQAKGFWSGVGPEMISSGHVELQVQDFFNPQAIKGAAVYFLRFIIHDWAEAESIKILKLLREAASPSSTLILFEFSVPYACADPEKYADGIDVRTAPYPLLPNLGKGGGSNPTYVDINMMSLLNGQERNLKQFIALGEASGWKLTSAKNDELSIFIYVPV